MDLLTIERFRGLRLDVDPNELEPGYLVGGRDFDIVAGDLRHRPGYTAWKQAPLGGIATNGLSVLPVVHDTHGAVFVEARQEVGPENHVDVFRGRTLVSTSGNIAVSSELTLGLVRFISQTRDWVLFSRPVGGMTNYWNLDALTFGNLNASCTVDGVAGRNPPRWTLALQSPVDERLAVCAANTGAYGPHAAATYPWRVWFSEPGDPTTWYTTRYYDFAPNDGESVQAIGAWGDMLFVLKRSKMFVLRSVTTLSNGAPQFNFTEIPIGFSLLNATVTAGRYGLYILCDAGLFVTDGGVPRKLSQAIDPLFADAANTLEYHDVGFGGNAPWSRIAYLDERVYCYTEGSDTTSVLHVYSVDDDTWSRWVFPFQAADIGALPYGVQGMANTGVGHLYLFGSYSAAGGTITNVYYEVDGALFADNGAGNSNFEAVFAPIYRPDGMVMREVFAEGWRHEADAGGIDLRFSTQADDLTEVNTFSTPVAAVAGALGARPQRNRVRWRQAVRGRRIVPRLTSVGDAHGLSLSRLELSIEDMRRRGL